MVFNLTIPRGIVLEVESSPKFQKRLLLQAVLRRSWRGRREAGKERAAGERDARFLRDLLNLAIRRLK
jgi:hypothetical protein